METAVAEVAEEHLVVVGGAAALAARLALGALPRVLAALADRVRAQLHAAGVHCGRTRKTYRLTVSLRCIRTCNT